MAQPLFYSVSHLLQNNLCQFLTFLLARLVGSIPKRNQHSGFLVVGKGEQALAQSCIKIADPARCKSLLCCSQAQMLNGNGYVDVAVRLAIRPHPCLIVEDGSHNIKRCRIEPVAMIALTQFLNSFTLGDDAEVPGLLIHSRWGKTHTLHDVVQFLLFHLPVLIISTTIPGFYQIQEIHRLFVLREKENGRIVRGMTTCPHLVRLTGLEPAHRRYQILSLARLPIPPQARNRDN